MPKQKANTGKTKRLYERWAKQRAAAINEETLEQETEINNNLNLVIDPEDSVGSMESIRHESSKLQDSKKIENKISDISTIDSESYVSVSDENLKDKYKETETPSQSIIGSEILVPKNNITWVSAVQNTFKPIGLLRGISATENSLQTISIQTESKKDDSSWITRMSDNEIEAEESLDIKSNSSWVDITKSDKDNMRKL
jgi:hypothetical protein